MRSKDKLLSETDFCIVDTETTGGNPVDQRIIDIAVIQFRGEDIVDKFQTQLWAEIVRRDSVMSFSGRGFYFNRNFVSQDLLDHLQKVCITHFFLAGLGNI